MSLAKRMSVRPKRAKATPKRLPSKKVIYIGVDPKTEKTSILPRCRRTDCYMIINLHRPLEEIVLQAFEQGRKSAIRSNLLDIAARLERPLRKIKGGIGNPFGSLPKNLTR